MNTNDFMKPAQLERSSFLWSELRLIIAAVALFLGGVPPVYLILRAPSLYGLISTLLSLCWIISGVASGYLLYRWYAGGQKLFGGRDKRDMFAFFVSVISGINLGLASIIRTNIGMSLGFGGGIVVFVIVGILYLVAAIRLYQRWIKNGKKIF